MKSYVVRSKSNPTDTVNEKHWRNPVLPKRSSEQKLTEKPIVTTAVGFGIQGGTKEKAVYLTEEHVFKKM